MLILADENCDRILVARLRNAGHEVKSIVEISPGTPDDGVLAAAAKEGRILLTFDLDFGLMMERSLEAPPAIVLARLHPLNPTTRAEVLAKFFATLGGNWRGKFYVVEPGSVRERAFEREE